MTIFKSLIQLMVLCAVPAKGDWLVKDHSFTNLSPLTLINDTGDYDKHIQYALQRTYKDSDGEAADVAMELGGLDGSPKTG